MKSRSVIRVVYESIEIGGFRGRIGLGPPHCQSCDKALGIKRNPEVTEIFPQELSPLIFSARLAAEELGIELEYVDIAKLSLIQKLKEYTNGKPVPRLEIGDVFLTGFPTRDQIVELYATYS